MSTTVTLLPSTEGRENVTGKPIRGTSSFGNSGRYNAVITATDMTEGRLYIEASMESNPTSWFAIPQDGLPYLEFPTGGGSEEEIEFSFVGNFTWIRARLDRTYTTVEGEVGHIAIALTIEGMDDLGSAPPSEGGGGTANGIQDISFENIGMGAQVFAAQEGTSNVSVLMRTLVEGEGVDITQTSSTVRISATANRTFVGLEDTANAVVNNAVLIGASNGITFTPEATANSALVRTPSGFDWMPLEDIGADAITLPIYLNGNAVVANSTGLDFSGDVSVSQSGSRAAIVINPPSHHTEWVRFRYTPGSSGYISPSDFLIEKTSGVTVTVVDGLNGIVAFSFTNRDFPPVAISMMGQSTQSNEFTYSSISPGIGTRKIAGGGTAAAPTLMGDFSGPVTLQARMIDTGATAGPGERAQGIVVFRF